MQRLLPSSSWNFGPKTKEVCITIDFAPLKKVPARKPEAESIYHSYLIMHMGGSLTIFWDEGELGNSVMLFYLLLLLLLCFPMCPSDSVPNWASCSFRCYTVLAFLKNGNLQITRRVLGCKSGEFGFGYFIKHRN